MVETRFFYFFEKPFLKKWFLELPLILVYFFKGKQNKK